jgi:hypothetical protein
MDILDNMKQMLFGQDPSNMCLRLRIIFLG